jgi:hypothetical protein
MVLLASLPRKIPNPESRIPRSEQAMSTAGDSCPQRTRRLLAALPAAATAIAFALAWWQWGNAYSLVMAKTIQLEFLVIHAGIFIGVLVLVTPESAAARNLRRVAIVLLVLMYCRGGYGLLGWHGVLTLLAIFAGTYGGLLFVPEPTPGMTTGRRTLGVEIGVRWAVAMLGYGLLANAFELPTRVDEWTGYRESAALGAWYFALLAGVEATPLYARLRGRG